jgi:RNA polymerase sigma-70 factor (ECF subfamily)
MNVSELTNFRRGESETLAWLYRTHVAAVERVVRRALARAGQLSAANTSDLVQEVFLRAFSPGARQSYDGQREFAPFLLTIANNVAIDWRRRRSRENCVTVVEPEVLGLVPSRGLSDFATFDQSLLAIASNYVRRLSPDLKAVHHSRFVLDTPQRKAAQVLGISRQNLRTLERRLMKGLRDEIGRAESEVEHADRT